jgi:hypothetical protein
MTTLSKKTATELAHIIENDNISKAERVRILTNEGWTVNEIFKTGKLGNYGMVYNVWSKFNGKKEGHNRKVETLLNFGFKLQVYGIDIEKLQDKLCKIGVETGIGSHKGYGEGWLISDDGTSNSINGVEIISPLMAACGLTEIDFVFGLIPDAYFDITCQHQIWFETAGLDLEQIEANCQTIENLAQNYGGFKIDRELTETGTQMIFTKNGKTDAQATRKYVKFLNRLIASKKIETIKQLNELMA